MIQVEKRKEVVKDLGLEGSEGKKLNDETIKKISDAVIALQEKDLERDVKDLEKENEIKDLKEKDIQKDKDIQSLQSFITISLNEMKNIASIAKDSIHIANFFKRNLLKIIDKQLEMNNDLFQSNKQSCGKKITQYTTKKAEVSNMKFKLGSEIDSLTELINNRINVQANVRKRNDLENQITECNDAIINYTNLLSKTKSDWDTFESNNRTENDELNALKHEVINRNIATIEEVDEIINRVETLHKTTFSLPDNDIILNNSTKKQIIIAVN